MSDIISGAEVIMACRNTEKAEAAAKDIQNQTPGVKLVIMKLDLSSLASVRSFCNEFKSKYNSLNLLINNAGNFCSQNTWWSVKSKAKVSQF